MFKHIRVNSQTQQGKRTYMEDEVLHANNPLYYLTGVFDGHGGKRTSKFLKDNFSIFFDHELNLTHYDISQSLFNTIKKINKIILKKSRKGWTSSGSTVNVCVLDKISQQLYILNLGDSRAIVCNTDGSGYSTIDHKASDRKERKSIERRGGWVSEDNRVNGTLVLSRAIGDLDVSKYISCKPDLFVLPIERKMRFILQASDGLFDVMTNFELCSVVNKYLDVNWSNKKIVSELMHQSLNVKKSTDNVSIILLAFT